MWKLFQELKSKTDVIYSKKKAGIEISEFDTMSLELVVKDILDSPDFGYLKTHFPKQISHKQRLLTISKNLVAEVKKMNREQDSALQVSKQGSRVFRDYDTKTHRQKRAASLEKFYNRIRTSEVSAGQASLKNSSSVFLLNKLRNNGASKTTASGEKRVPPRVRVKRAELPPQLLTPKPTTENSLVASIPYTRETSVSAQTRALRQSKHPFAESECSMESTLIPQRRRPTAKFGQSGRRGLNASDNVYQGQQGGRSASMRGQRAHVVESEKVVVPAEEARRHTQQAKLSGSRTSEDENFTRRTQMTLKSKLSNSQQTTTMDLNTMGTTSVNFRAHRSPELTSISNQISHMKDLPSELEIESGCFEQNRTRGAEGKEKKKSYRTENPKKKGKKTGKTGQGRLKRGSQAKSNVHVRTRKVKMKSTQNFYQKQRKKKKFLAPPKNAEIPLKRVNNRSLDRQAAQHKPPPKAPKKCFKKARGKNASFAYTRSTKQAPKARKRSMNPAAKARVSKRTQSRESSTRRAKTGLRRMEEKILSKPLPPSIQKSGNLLGDMTEFSRSGMDTEGSSLVKKSRPGGYKSKRKPSHDKARADARRKDSLSGSKHSKQNRRYQAHAPSDSSESEEGLNAFEQVQNALIKSHKNLKNFVFEFREQGSASLSRSHICKRLTTAQFVLILENLLLKLRPVSLAAPADEHVEDFVIEIRTLKRYYGSLVGKHQTRAKVSFDKYIDQLEASFKIVDELIDGLMQELDQQIN